jgi:hypothetical protein
MSYADVMLVLAAAGLLASLALPETAQANPAIRLRSAAHLVGSTLRSARQRAVATGRSAAVVFTQRDGRWTFDTCIDGNRNGLRRTEMASGVDTCDGHRIDVSIHYPGVAVAVDPLLPGPDDDPPTSDPVRLGSADMISFSPAGSGTAGTLYLRTAANEQYAIRIGNMTGRVRMLRYDPGARLWGPA